MIEIPRPGETGHEIEADGRTIIEVTEIHSDIHRGLSQALVIPDTSVRSSESHRITGNQERIMSQGFAELIPFTYVDQAAKDRSRTFNDGFTGANVQLDIAAGLISKDTSSVVLCRPTSLDGPAVIISSLSQHDAYRSRTVGEVMEELPNSILITDEGINDQNRRYPHTLTDIVQLDDELTPLDIVLSEPNPGAKKPNRYIPSLTSPEYPPETGIVVGRLVLDRLVRDERNRTDYTNIGFSFTGVGSEESLVAGVLVQSSGRLRRMAVEAALESEPQATIEEQPVTKFNGLRLA